MVFIHLTLVVLLTLLTQIGGLAYLLALVCARRVSRTGPIGGWAGPAMFIGLYVGLSLLATVTAPLFGRTPLPCFVSEHAPLAMQSPVYCALNRHYVTPALKSVVEGLATHVDGEYPGAVTLALDAGFPFIDGFPLLPHLSHRDGLKLDLAFYYRGEAGDYLRGKTASPIGYWAFEDPSKKDSLPCSGRNDLMTLRWDMPWFRPFLRDYTFEAERTRTALEWLVAAGRDAGVSKVFIEPHLADALTVESDILRFQGCRAARHDDHIHFEIAR